MEYLEAAGKILALPGALATIVGIVWQFRRWQRPLDVEPNFSVRFGEDAHETIGTTITNRSKVPVYVVECYAKQAYSRPYVWRRHLEHPLARPTFYQVFRYRAVVFDLMKDKPLKLEAYQPVTLSHRVGSNMLSRFDGPLLQVEVTLSTGKRMLSKKLRIRGGDMPHLRDRSR